MGRFGFQPNASDEIPAEKSNRLRTGRIRRFLSFFTENAAQINRQFS